MFDLLLSLAVASAPAVPSQAAVKIEPVLARATPSCSTGPVRVRLRTVGGTVQIAATAIRVEGVDRAALAAPRPE